jgi:catechol 2,3-dioxygenase-like lactoylglutathione lyase family enzyme
MQFNESHHNMTPENGSGARDGGGFDCDLGSEDCLITYNWSHDNQGEGFLLVVRIQGQDSHPEHAIRAVCGASLAALPGSQRGLTRQNQPLVYADVNMKPHISVLTLGVDDLERALAFYRDGLGLRTAGIVGREFEHGAVAFFDLQAGLRLAIWRRADIAHDAGLTVTDPSPTEFTIGHNLNSAQDVDDVMEQAQQAGARLVKAAQRTFWGGYAGYFQDPDGHLWEVVWNPALSVAD